MDEKYTDWNRVKISMREQRLTEIGIKTIGVKSAELMSQKMYSVY